MNDDQCPLCVKDITEEKVKHEFNKMETNKSPGNNGLTKEFYEPFWDRVRMSLPLPLLRLFYKKGSR